MTYVSQHIADAPWSSSIRSSGRTFFAAPAAPIYGVLLIGVIVLYGANFFLLFEFSQTMMRELVSSIGFFLIAGFLARWIGFPMIAGILESIMLTLSVSFLAPLCAVVAASANYPVVDATLSQIDQMLFGFDRQSLATLPENWPVFTKFMTIIYNSLTVQPFAIMILLFATRRDRRAWTLLCASGIAMMLSLTIFLFFPAYGTPPYVLRFVEVLDGARDGTLRMLDEGALTGIVTFPSIHAAAAAILAWGFSGFGRIGVPFVVLNMLMIASALFVGGHYLIDLIGGVLVASAAIAVAKRLQGRIAAAPRRPLAC